MNRTISSLISNYASLKSSVFKFDYSKPFLLNIIVYMPYNSLTDNSL